jgi:hypothetical protein
MTGWYQWRDLKLVSLYRCYRKSHDDSILPDPEEHGSVV